MNVDLMDDKQMEVHRIEFLKQADDKMVEYAPDTLLVIVQRAEEARQEVSRNGLTRKKQLIKTVGTDELLEAEKAVKDNPHDSDKLTKLEALRSQSCLRKATTALSDLDKVSKILTDQGKEENVSKSYLLDKLAKISEHEMGEGNKFQTFGDDKTYKKLIKEDRTVNSTLSKTIAKTLGSASSLANSIHKAYGYPLILDHMKEQCEETAKQNLPPQDELSQMADDLNQITKKIPASPEARMIEKHLLENIQPTLESISAAAKETIMEVSANGIGADKLAEPIRKLTMNFNQVFKASQVMTKYVDISKDAEKTFLLETIGELSRRNLTQDQDLQDPDFEVLTLNSLTSPDKYVELSSEERVGKGTLSQNVIYIAQSATLLADLAKNNYHSSSNLEIIAEELKGMPCDFFTPKKLLEQLQTSDLQSKVDKSQLESGEAAKPEKNKVIVSSVKGSASKEVSSTLFAPVSNTLAVTNEPVTLRKISEESRQVGGNLTSTSFTRFMAANRESDGMNTSFYPAAAGKKIEKKEEPQKLGPSHS
ncbi:hypothetical protein [Rickettsiella endosymbiont of Aleochara curtula]|uniref:hypothetical protein n=1 Tax=Rickettsiella endosymbiont of Aleochara curtula TaxID=3077936 RepID=UPI00313B296F